MDCPVCGKPLKEGRVFCEHCGKEIQIVPVFEPEIEDSITKSLGKVLEVFKEEEQTETKTSEIQAWDSSFDEKTEQVGGKKHKALVIYYSVGIALLVIALIFIMGMLINYNSYDYQMKMASNYYELNEHGEVAKYTKRAMEIAPNSSDAKMLLANSYIENGQLEQAKELLEKIIENDKTHLNAYKELIALYDKEQAYEKISVLLEDCTDTTIIENFKSYCINEPQFSEEEGTYDSPLSLKILADSYGTVYYTTDGTIPTEDDIEYMGPIRLEHGEHEIKAVYINQFDVKSDIVTKKYIIDIAKPDEPEISVESGTYQTPQTIETTLIEGFEIYYTTDGSTPTRNSTPYLVPIPMPLGNSVFKFITYSDDGIASDVSTREYTLEPDTALSKEAAIIILKQALIRNGVILDMDGHILGSPTYREYELNSAFTEDDQIFYLIIEYVREADGTKSKTGNQYAVHTATSELYKASTNYAGYYMVEPFE